MKFTIVKNTEGDLAKVMKSDGTTLSSAQLTNGTYAVKKVVDLNEFNDCLDKLNFNEAIILGIPDVDTGRIASKGMLENTKIEFRNDNVISRSKEFFSFKNEAILLFDIDTDDGANVECKSYDDVLRILTDLDPQIKDAEILIRHSSSSYIYKWNKGDKEQIKGAGSYHLYLKAKNVDTNLEAYVKSLENKAWELGYGYFKVSKAGSMLKRQVFDSAVFSPERLVFEAGMMCESPYEQERPEAYFREGGYVDCRNAPSVDTDKVLQAISNAQASNQVKADGVRQSFVKQEEQKLIDAGCLLWEAKEKVERLLSDSILPSQHIIILDDGTKITVQDIFLNPKKYDNKTCYDPIEYEKGRGKAMIYSNNGLNPIIHSFVHGGVNYKLAVDYDTIYKIAEQIENISDVVHIRTLASSAKLSNDDRKKIAGVLKGKKLVKSINDIEISEQELVQQREDDGFVDVGSKGEVYPTLDNLRALMEINDMSYQYDVILKNADIRHSSINQSAPNKEEAIVSTVKKFAFNTGINPNIVDNLAALSNSAYSNPLMDFVKESHTRYDGLDYIAQVSETLTTTASSVYVKEVLTKWFVQCIGAWDYERTSPLQEAKPKFESVLVFQGKQGVQKTKFFSALLPQEQEHYIKTGAMLNPNDKDSLMQNTSYAIVELGEIESTFSKSDIGALKAFLSNSIDEYRVPYGKTASKNKRCTSFCGSVNESGFLRDPTGARRFWVIPVESIDFQAFENIDKSMLWAQAYDLYINGAKWWFDNTDVIVQKELTRLHNAHQSYSLADEIFAEIKDNNAKYEYMGVGKMFEKWTNRHSTKKDINDLATILEGAGYKRNSKKEFHVPTEFQIHASVQKVADSVDSWEESLII